MCYRDHAWWLTRKRIVFDVFVEFYAVHRVLRQLGGHQDFPLPRQQLDTAHKHTRKGQGLVYEASWASAMVTWADAWAAADTASHAIVGPYDESTYGAYLHWFHGATRWRCFPVPARPQQHNPEITDTFATQPPAAFHNLRGEHRCSGRWSGRCSGRSGYDGGSSPVQEYYKHSRHWIEPWRVGVESERLRHWILTVQNDTGLVVKVEKIAHLRLWILKVSQNRIQYPNVVLSVVVAVVVVVVLQLVLRRTGVLNLWMLKLVRAERKRQYAKDRYANLSDEKKEANKARRRELADIRRRMKENEKLADDGAGSVCTEGTSIGIRGDAGKSIGTNGDAGNGVGVCVDAVPHTPQSLIKSGIECTPNVVSDSSMPDRATWSSVSVRMENAVFNTPVDQTGRVSERFSSINQSGCTSVSAGLFTPQTLRSSVVCVDLLDTFVRATNTSCLDSNTPCQGSSCLPRHLHGVNVVSTSHSLDDGENLETQESVHGKGDCNVVQATTRAERKKQLERSRYANLSPSSKQDKIKKTIYNRSVAKSKHNDSKQGSMNTVVQGSAIPAYPEASRHGNNVTFDSGIWEPDSPTAALDEEDLDCQRPVEDSCDIFEDDESRVFHVRDSMAAQLATPNSWVVLGTTTAVDVVQGPDGAWPSEMAIDVAVTETYTWIPIAGERRPVRTPNQFIRNIRVPIAYPGVSKLRTRHHCRSLIKRALFDNLIYDDYYEELSGQDWGRACPVGVENTIQELANGMVVDSACRLELSISLSVQWSFCETTALLHSCHVANPLCSICYEGVAVQDHSIVLPNCRHMFHHMCLFNWFKINPKCPTCLRDYDVLLPPDYSALRENMNANAPPQDEE